MREIGEVLRGGFDAHVGEIGRAGGAGAALSARTVRDVRRKRAWRAGVSGTVSAAAVVGVVATAVAYSGGDGPSADQPWYITDPNSLGPCTSFIPANGALLPEGMYVGRAYVDPAAGFVVAVTPDGKATRVQPGPDGDYPFDFGDGHVVSLMVPTSYPLVMDFIGNSGGGGVWEDAAADSWDWTMEPLSPAPAGINETSLFATFTMSIGFDGGQGYETGAVPDGAVTEAVAIYDDGHKATGVLVKDLPAPRPGEDFAMDGLAAVALRVTLADGEVWQMRADYTPEDSPVLPCVPMPPSGFQVDPSPTPAGVAPDGDPAPSVSEGASDSQAWGDPLSGPEAAVFQCGAPLPAALEEAGDLKARRASGNVSVGDPDVFDVGDDGVVIEATSSLWEMPLESLGNPRVPGWQSYGSGHDGLASGMVSLAEVVALREGVIVAAAREPVEDWTAGGVGGAATAFGQPGSGGQTQPFITAINGIQGLLEPCAGVDPADFDGADLAVVYGFGPDAADMTYGWTWVTPAA